MNAPKHEYGGRCLPPSQEPNQEEKNWGIVAHLSPLAGSLVCGLTFLGPLVVWLVKKDQSEFVRLNALHALGFNIALFIPLLIAIALTCVTGGILGLLLTPIMILVGLAALAYIIIGAVNASNGYVYAYPLVGDFMAEKAGTSSAQPQQPGPAGGAEQGQQPGFPHAEDDQPRGSEPPSEPPRQP